MNQYPWLQEYLNQWLDLLLKQKTPQAVLLSGAKGLAKKELAQMMAHYAVCENLSEKGACLSCKGCHLYHSHSHTDILTVFAEKEIIKVEQIRNLTKNVTLSTTRNQHKIMIVEDAEKMNKASANALLKTLEEPPENVVIILTTSEIGYLLPTIKSRCFKINVKIADKNSLSDYLSAKNLGSMDEINVALLMTNNSPLMSHIMLETDAIAEVKLMLSDLNELMLNKASVLDVSKRWMKNEWVNHLNYVANYFLNAVKKHNGINHEDLPEISEIGQITKLYQANIILNFIRKVHVFMTRIHTSLKPELLLEELLIAWKNDFQ